MKAQPVSYAYCQAPDAPYKNYACLDDYLGQDFLTRLINYYRLEWGHDAAPADPKAPPSSRPGWPTTPETTPPMPFTEWPYGGTTSIGVTRPNSVDSPFMNAISNTAFGKFLQDAHIQIYGWVNGGGNLSTNGVRPGGNVPVAYDYTPNTFQLDQARALYRAPAGHGADRSHRLGLPLLGDCTARTTATRQPSASRATSCSAITWSTATTSRWCMASFTSPASARDCCSAWAVSSRCPTSRPARAQQLHVLALADLLLGQLHEHGPAGDLCGDQELVPAVRRDRGQPTPRRGTSASGCRTRSRTRCIRVAVCSRIRARCRP